MLDWMLVASRCVAFDRSARDRSIAAGNPARSGRPAPEPARAPASEGAMFHRVHVSRPMDWNTGWHRSVRDFARGRWSPRAG